MSNRLHRLFAATLLALAPFAAPISMGQPPALAKAPGEFQMYVWKVQNPALEADAPADYLIGTMHVPVGAGAQMPAEVRALIRSASTVVTEADTSQVTPDLVARYSVLKGGKTLKQLLPAPSWKKLAAAAKRMGLPAEQAAQMEPWFLNVGLTLPKPDGQPVIDELVQQQAASNHVSLQYLESAEEQLGYMDSVKQEEDLRQLVDTLDHPEQATHQFESLRKGYFSGDLKAIEKIVFDPEQLKRYPDFYQKMLYARTARWAPKVDQLCHDEDVVVAVGLGHLIGDKGLVKLLKDRGYKVEPLAL